MKTYAYEIICKNCGEKSLSEQYFGRSRPSKTECPNCGCLADTYALTEAQ